jgi:caffeoyl-CoA O-methyltransferase
MESFTLKEIETYCISKSFKPSKELNDLETYTRSKVDMSQMLIGPLEGSVLGFLIRLNGAKRVLEFGTFTGYSALTMAENLPEDGEVYTLDINQETVDIGKKYWEQSSHGKKITSLIGPALESLSKIKGKIDLVFIDADKENYLNYLNKSLELLSPKGVIVLDNALWSGQVLKENPEESSTKALKEVNDFVANNKNLYGSLLPIRDGMFLIQKI